MWSCLKLFSTIGGRAKLQCFQAGTDSEDDFDDEPQKKKKKPRRAQPLLIAICTPLMSRVHKYVQQAGEIVFL